MPSQLSLNPLDYNIQAQGVIITQNLDIVSRDGSSVMEELGECMRSFKGGDRVQFVSATLAVSPRTTSPTHSTLQEDQFTLCSHAAFQQHPLCSRSLLIP